MIYYIGLIAGLYLFGLAIEYYGYQVGSIQNHGPFSPFITGGIVVFFMQVNLDAISPEVLSIYINYQIGWYLFILFTMIIAGVNGNKWRRNKLNNNGWRHEKETYASSAKDEIIPATILKIMAEKDSAASTKLSSSQKLV